MVGVIVLTAMTINLRVMLYSASLTPHFQHLAARWRLLLAYFIVDQSYVLGVGRYQRAEGGGPHGHWYFLGAGAMMWLTWQAANALGVYLGAGISPAWQLDFAIPLVFLVLLVPNLRDRPHVVAAIIGGLVASAATALPYRLGIVTGALAGIAAGYCFERWAVGER